MNPKIIEDNRGRGRLGVGGVGLPQLFHFPIGKGGYNLPLLPLTYPSLLTTLFYNPLLLSDPPYEDMKKICYTYI